MRATRQEGPRVLRMCERLLAATERGLDADKQSVGAARRWNEGPRRQEGGSGHVMRCLKVKDLRGWRGVRECDRKLRAKLLGNWVGRSPEQQGGHLPTFRPRGYRGVVRARFSALGDYPQGTSGSVWRPSKLSQLLGVPL